MPENVLVIGVVVFLNLPHPSSSHTDALLCSLRAKTQHPRYALAATLKALSLQGCTTGSLASMADELKPFWRTVWAAGLSPVDFSDLLAGRSRPGQVYSKLGTKSYPVIAYLQTTCPHTPAYVIENIFPRRPVGRADWSLAARDYLN